MHVGETGWVGAGRVQRADTPAEGDVERGAVQRLVPSNMCSRTMNRPGISDAVLNPSSDKTKRGAEEGACRAGGEGVSRSGFALRAM